MTVAIRLAGVDDADSVAELIGELLTEIMSTIGQRAFRYHAAETRARARQYLEQGIYTVLVAREVQTDVDVGVVALCESHALYAEGAFGIIPEFYVRPAFRSAGIGRMLIDEAKRAASNKGWKRLEVTTPPVPAFERTLDFYQDNGFTRSGGWKLKLVL